MSDTLYAISQDLQVAIDGGIVFDEETGEILFDSDSIDALTVSLANKLEASQAVATAKRAKAATIKAEVKRLSDWAKRLEAAADSLDAYCLRCVEPLEGRIETDHYSIGTRTSDRLEVLDEAAIPAEYLREKVTVSVDKAKAKAALKAGEEVPGCALVKNITLNVR